MIDTAQVTCGLSKGPFTHKETWWWNEEVAEAVKEKKKKYGNWKKRKIDRGMEEYKKSKQNAKRVISLGKRKKHTKECASDLNDPNHQNKKPSCCYSSMADRTAPVVKLTLTLTLILPGLQQ